MMASDTVLSDAELCALAHARLGEKLDPADGDLELCRDIERAVVAALAAQSGVDVEALACNVIDKLMFSSRSLRCEHSVVEDVIRLALATVEARHAQREAWWRELTSLYQLMDCQTAQANRARELRKLLGLEG